MANGLNFYDLNKKLTPGFALTEPWGYIHVYYHSSELSLFVFIDIYLRSQDHLQDHWSSGLKSQQQQQ